jgi:hypothetical protein
LNVVLEVCQSESVLKRSFFHFNGAVFHDAA